MPREKLLRAGRYLHVPVCNDRDLRTAINTRRLQVRGGNIRQPQRRVHGLSRRQLLQRGCALPVPAKHCQRRAVFVVFELPLQAGYAWNGLGPLAGSVHRMPPKHVLSSGPNAKQVLMLDYINRLRLVVMRTLILVLSMLSPCLASNCSFYTGNYTCACDACPYVTTEPAQCPFNMTTLATGASAISECACLAGTIGNHSAGCAPCPAGYFCVPSSRTQLSCDRAYVCPYGSVNSNGQTDQSADVTCSVNYYRNSTCLPCPSGSGTLYIGAVDITECTCATTDISGKSYYTYLNLSTSQCVVCPPAFYCALGSTQPLECPPGTFCRRGSLAPEICPVGFYCPGGIPDPVPCEAGTYCVTGSRSKETCVTGFYCPYTAIAQLPCTETNFCPAGSGEPLPCPAGKYCPANTSTPHGCPSGFYCNASVAEPAVCPNMTSSTSNAASVEECVCVANMYGSVFHCTDCPEGGFSPPGSRNFSDCLCDVGFKHKDGCGSPHSD